MLKNTLRIENSFLYSVQLCALYYPSGAPTHNSTWCVQAKDDSFPLNKFSYFLTGKNGVKMLGHKWLTMGGIYLCSLNQIYVTVTHHGQNISLSKLDCLNVQGGKSYSLDKKYRWYFQKGHIDIGKGKQAHKQQQVSAATEDSRKESDSSRHDYFHSKLPLLRVCSPMRPETWYFLNALFQVRN